MTRTSLPAPRRIALAVALACCGAAFAQQAAEPAAAASAPESGKLETVTVTAERRSENIKDVPMAISTLKGEKLDVINSGGQDVRALSGRVPSLNIESSFGRAFPRFYIRGYGNTDFRLNASQPVSLVYDDVVQENPILKGFPVFDVDQIEVLRGPQGTLFGRNSPAGVVKFDSVKPSTKKLEGYASLGYGTDNMINLEAAVNVPLSEDWAARVSLLNQTRDDWVENTHDAGPTQDLEGYRDSAVRAQLLYAPHKDFSALFNVHARDLDGSARLFRANIIKPGTNDLVDGFDEDKISIDGKNESRLRTKGANARLRWGLGEYSLYSITGYETLDTYNRGDIDGGFGAVFAPPSGPGTIPFSSETADGIPDHKQFTQEVRVESNYAGPINWQAGLYYFHEDFTAESFSYDSLSGGAQNGYSRSRQKNDAYAAFGALTWQATPALKLRGGLRYTHDKKDFALQDYNSAVFGTPATMADLIAAGPITANPSDNKTSWDLSGTYALSAETNLYARVANGFRATSVQGAGAFNGQSVAGPETNTSVEAGIKTDLFDRRARLSAGVFHYTVKDQQLTAVGGAANSNILLNADKTVGQGFELDFQALITDNLLVTAGASYNHTELKDRDLAVAVCAACTVTDPLDGSGRALIDGNPLPQAPKVTANVTLRYSIPHETGEWYVYTDWAYRSKVNFFLYESKEFTGKALTEGGLRLGYIWGNGKYEVAAYGRNITNQIRVTGGIDFNNLTGFINEPRTWGVQGRLSF
ncbi:TonB-dependent receptor [Caldimonas sp. KR1-144]|uniref:TonB-dependent receptor n=1 Tax=Caldimonas sp. KR1-144 TaxID=3400911 RepID=UPI003C040224